VAVSVCDISANGARVRHAQPLEMGKKARLRLAIDGRPAAETLESVVVWTQADLASAGHFVSGLRTWAPADEMNRLLRDLGRAGRTSRIEELRASDRFFLQPTLDGRWESDRIRIEDLSSHGARIETHRLLSSGAAGTLKFDVEGQPRPLEVPATVVWSGLKSVDPSRHRAGLSIPGKSEGMRLVIGQLCESGRASIDTHSLGLKLKVIRARARQLAPSHRDIESSGVPPEQYILVQCVREELRLNPSEAMHWYRKVRLMIQDPATRTAAPAIADHPDALAVWEYLDRSVDPSIIGRTFALPPR